MTPEFYADQYRRYATFCRNYGDNHLYKIACGANEGNYAWTETLMNNVGNRMNGLSMHYYTLPTGSWSDKGSATQFDETQYFATIQRTLFMEELLTKHSTIMDKYDPKKRVGLITDEWGTWYNVEPETNPGFLYQQNTLRDAIVAGINLNIFNAHSDRVQMANIAQIVNVLQAVILTDNDKMLLTPTYWVFWLYKVHHEATLLPINIACGKYKLGDKEMEAVSVSASRDKAGKIHITLVNIDPKQAQALDIDLRGIAATKVSGKILTSAQLNDHNTFDKPVTVAVKDFSGAKLSKNRLSIALPAKSVLMVEIE
jgi:alpha-N-arabinofuranosidase